jgi:hypothetical protein
MDTEELKARLPSGTAIRKAGSHFSVKYQSPTKMVMNGIEIPKYSYGSTNKEEASALSDVLLSIRANQPNYDEITRIFI